MILIKKVIAHVHRELCAVYVPQDTINIHIVCSLSAFVDRGVYLLSISTNAKDTFKYSSRRAGFGEVRPDMLTRDLECTL